MPEIGEVARIVSFLKKHVVGRTIAKVKVQNDDNVYGKAGTTAEQFQKAMTGKKVLDARQQGKYFWMVMDSPPHPLMHFGMTGWMKFSNDDSSYYKPTKAEEDGWPPKFWKFVLETSEGHECAFVDARRLGRIRLVDVDGEDMRKTTPLKENGPDPVIDRDILTQEWLAKKMRSKKVPVKALLLDQANMSGVGNWVGDEVLYQARIHPEQYSNQFSDAEIKRLHDALIEVCNIAVDTLGEPSKFPDNWLMKYRWAKGKKDAKLPNGDRIIFLTVGGRTSAVVPSVQKKTGEVAAEVPSVTGDSQTNDSGAKAKAKKGAKPEVSEEVNEKPSKKGQRKAVDHDVVGMTPKKKKQKTSNAEEKPVVTLHKEKADTRANVGRRRSARVSAT